MHMAFQLVADYRIDIDIARGVVIRLKVEGDGKWQVVPLDKASSMAVDALISTLQGPKTLAYDNEKIRFKTT